MLYPGVFKCLLNFRSKQFASASLFALINKDSSLPLYLYLPLGDEKCSAIDQAKKKIRMKGFK